MGFSSVTSGQVVGMGSSPLPYAGQRVSASQGMISRIAFCFLAPFVLFLFSRLLDVTIPGLHLPFVFGSIVVIATILSGEWLPVMRMTPTWCFLLFTAWFCFASVFGEWRGGSFIVFKDYWVKSLLIFLVISSLAVTMARIWLLVHLITVGIGIAMLVALAVGETDIEGRLMMSAGEFANSNALGMFAVVGLAFCWHSASNPNRVPLTSLWWGAAALPMLYVVARSGSRTALLMLLISLLFVLYRSSWRQRILLAVLAVLGGCATFLTAPEVVLKRFSTLPVLSQAGLDDDASDGERSAVSSTESRRYLLEKSLLITLQHPLFGVGPGNFMVAENQIADKQDRRGNWHVTHNGFTELSSETGLPGFLLYMAALVWVWRSLGRLSARAAKVGRPAETSHSAMAFRTLLLVTLVATFFGISLYHYFVPAFMALAVGLLRSAEETGGDARKPEGAAVEGDARC